MLANAKKMNFTPKVLADSDGDNSDEDSSVYSGLSGENEESDESESEFSEYNSDDDNNPKSSVSKTPDNEENIGEILVKKAVSREDAYRIFEPKKVAINPATKPYLDPNNDEYAEDSSDEEDLRNTVGDVPMRWYDDYDHLGYDLDGKKIYKPPNKDELDRFLDRMENPDYWRTVKDRITGQNVVLSEEDVETIKNIQSGKFPDSNYDPYEPWIDFFSYETMIHPVTDHPEHKRSFIPSLTERRLISKYTHAIKMGWMQRKKRKPPPGPQFYMLWDSQSERHKRFNYHIPAPKMLLPGHGESYNPPAEYLFTEKEKKEWLEKDPATRRVKVIPQQFSALRHVPAYEAFTKERFQRCLDLYMCPRQRKAKLNISPDDLLPKLPKPKDLQPFPTTLSLVYAGHKDRVRCLSVEPSGQYLASGSDDCTVKIWEIATTRCVTTLALPDKIMSIAWCPNNSISLIAIAFGKTVAIVNPKVGDKLVSENTDIVLANPAEEQIEGSDNKSGPEWRTANEKEWQLMFRVYVTHTNDVKQVTWHCKGDYFATVLPEGGNKSVYIHQLSKRRSQNPFSKAKGRVQCVLFHPSKPFFFVATQTYIRIYNLLKQELSKKLMTNVKWISSMAVHHGGDNVIIGSYDCRLSWFDLDLSTKAYQTLRYHKRAIRQVAFHSKYPLFASASDDGAVVVSHGMVYNDFLQNALIVPVKILRGHQVVNDLGALDCQFHTTQPWIFTSGADGRICLFT